MVVCRRGLLNPYSRASFTVQDELQDQRDETDQVKEYLQQVIQQHKKSLAAAKKRGGGGGGSGGKGGGGPEQVQSVVAYQV